MASSRLPNSQLSLPVILEESFSRRTTKNPGWRGSTLVIPNLIGNPGIFVGATLVVARFCPFRRGIFVGASPCACPKIVAAGFEPAHLVIPSKDGYCHCGLLPLIPKKQGEAILNVLNESTSPIITGC